VPTTRRRRRLVTTLLSVGLAAALLPAHALAQVPAPGDVDGRAGLVLPTQEASTDNLDLLSSTANPAEVSGWNSDLAFTRGHAVMGNYQGFTIWDVSDPAAPTLRTAVSCPGGQNDVSAHGDLLFVSVESGGYTACDDGSGEGSQVFRGVRIFDISDLDRPEQVAAVQTCRGSHTHSLLDPTLLPGASGAADRLYVYVSGTAGVRGDAEGERLGCSSGNADDPNPSRWRIDIIEVPLAAPQDAALVSGPRVFAEGGRVDGLQQQPPSELHPSGTPWLPSPITRSCHDITTYAEAGLAAGACEGNGILLDISDPVNPVRVAAVSDPNFAYWHSATFNDDATKVVFTDEWGGGILPHCQPVNNRPEWGANGIYDVVRGADGTFELELASYYKIPNTQSPAENCVAHNGSLVPVPGRDVMVQAWYQGGISVFDFTDSRDPVELAWFDRGPWPGVPAQDPAGFWSAYWYDGAIFGSEIARGFDSFALRPDAQLSAAELAAAEAVRVTDLNPQAQVRYGPGDVPGPPPGVCARVRPVSFRDVSGGSHATNISCVAGYGIALGQRDGTYRPLGDVRRDQMASFLARTLEVAGVELPSSPRSAFPDTRGNTHQRAIDQLAELGILQGRRDGTYGPADTVTRGQMASFLVRTLEEVLGHRLTAGESPFTDTEGSVHERSIAIVAELRIALGRTATTYEPNADVRRDQMASFLARTLRELDREGIELAALR
jgi:hypothetical protein